MSAAGDPPGLRVQVYNRGRTSGWGYISKKAAAFSAAFLFLHGLDFNLVFRYVFRYNIKVCLRLVTYSIFHRPQADIFP